MMAYAERTEVSVYRSQEEIERTVARYGATNYSFGTGAGRAAIQFEIDGRTIRIVLPLPDKSEERFRFSGEGNRRKERTPDKAHVEWGKECRRCWRALALVIKAKLEAVESGITTVEQEFLAHLLLPNRQTVGEWMRPQLAAASQGKMPALLDLRR